MSRDKESVIAATALNARDFFFKPDSRDASVSVDQINYITSRASRSNDEDTLIYIVNFSDNKGFAILSAIDENDPVYAVTDYGQYIPGGENVTGVEDYVQRTKALLSIEKDSSIIGKPGDPSHLMYIETVRDTIENVDIPAKIKNHWGQDGLYARYCPYYSSSTNRGATGCVITAVATIMSYYCYPYSIKIDFDGDSSDLPMKLQWQEINKHSITKRNCENDGLSLCRATAEAHDAIAKLMRQLGHLVNARYDITPDGYAYTGASERDAANLFLKFGYEFSGYYFYNGVNDDKLSNDYILLMLGIDSNNRFMPHCFIVDGCRKLTVKSVEKAYDTVTVPWTLVYERDLSTVTNNYMHVNWGWDGEADGYYRDHVFNTTKVIERDIPRTSLQKPDSISYDMIYYAAVRKQVFN